MCFRFDACPPDLPPGLAGPPIAGGAGTEVIELASEDGTRFSAAVAQSPGSPNGGIVIYPDVRGLYPFYCVLAERFAQAGYPAIAFDYFGRTAGLGPRDEHFEYMPHVQQLSVPTTQADAAAAAAALKHRTGVTRTATVGFCLGGFLSFMAAVDLPEIAAAVGFYGILDGSRLGVAGPLERTADMHCPVLGLFGGADQAIPTDQVEQFDRRLADAGVEHDIHVYAGAPHSFFDRRFEEYAEASADAWRRMLDFLARHIGSPDSA